MAEAIPSNPRQWRLIAGVLAVVVVILAAAYYWFLAGDYAVLVRSVRPEAAAAIVEQLKKDAVPYELRDGGTTILVPAREVDAAKLDVSGEELPLKGTVGFELFNQSDMGLTDFAQKVNYQRALQGEIARTIMAMDGIAYARVHIALPERSLFRATRSEPRAAVTLTPQSGVEIDPQRIAGIQRLVAATVPDLAIDQVAILNERGQLLTPEFSDVAAAAQSESALESNYRERVMRALAEAAPRAEVEVKVTVIPRGGATGADAPTPSDNGEARNHSIRVIVFERSALTPADEQAIRRAVAAEVALDPHAGDDISFSPMPQVASATPAAPPSSAPPAKETREAAQDRFMASLGRAWEIALSILGIGAVGLLFITLQRSRLARRQALVTRIREHLLLAGGAADAA